MIERAAARSARRFAIAGEHWNVHEERGRLVYQDDDGLLDLPLPKLHGRHQFENAGTAIATLRASGLALPLAAFEAGIARAEWPARMQRLSQGTLKQLVPAGSELWLDGGHNADGGRAIAAALGDLEERVSRPLVMIVGMLATKDSAGFLRNFSGLARRVIAVPIPQQEKSVPAETLADIARSVGIPAESRDTIEVGADRDVPSRADARAAHPDHRLALSRGRGAGAERHAAGVKPKRNGRDKPGHGLQLLVRCDHTAVVIHCSSFCFGAAPTWREAISPFLKIISVGIDMMPYFCATFGFSSTLSLTILTFSPSAPAISSSAGAIIRQGPHHSAQKSTTTGPVALSTSVSKVASETLPTAMEHLVVRIGEKFPPRVPGTYGRHAGASSAITGW